MRELDDFLIEAINECHEEKLMCALLDVFHIFQ